MYREHNSLIIFYLHTSLIIKLLVYASIKYYYLSYTFDKTKVHALTLYIFFNVKDELVFPLL